MGSARDYHLYLPVLALISSFCILHQSPCCWFPETDSDNDYIIFPILQYGPSVGIFFRTQPLCVSLRYRGVPSKERKVCRQFISQVWLWGYHPCIMLRHA